MTDEYNGGKAYTKFLKLFRQNLIEQRIKMDRKTARIFRIKCIMKRCREKQRWQVLARMCYKYNMKPVNEAYYD